MEFEHDCAFPSPCGVLVLKSYFEMVDQYIDKVSVPLRGSGS